MTLVRLIDMDLKEEVHNCHLSDIPNKDDVLIISEGRGYIVKHRIFSLLDSGYVALAVVKIKFEQITKKS